MITGSWDKVIMALVILGEVADRLKRPSSYGIPMFVIMT